MKLAFLTFTNGGQFLARKLQKHLGGDVVYNRELEGGIKEHFSQIWTSYEGLVFIGATGIAVRYISKHLDRKDVDPAVVVCDENGQFAISLLSGHLGGANGLAKDIATLLGAEAVITTASDGKKIQSIDLFAKDHDLVIEDLGQLAPVMGAMVDGKTVYMENTTDIEFPYEHFTENLEEAEAILAITEKMIDFKGEIPMAILRPKNLIVGVGCKRNTDYSVVKSRVEKCFQEQGLSMKSISAIHSIDVKKDEEALLQLAEELKVPFRTFSAETLLQVPGEFQGSDFVKSQVGVENVSGRSALATGGELVIDTFKGEGVTVSIGKNPWGKLYVVGLGPGGREHMTQRAVDVIKDAQVVVAYTPYLDYVKEFLPGKETYCTGMRGEIQRCERAIQYVREGKKVAILSTGDAGLYAMAGPILEMAPQTMDVEIVPGVSAQFSAAAELGAPLMHDVATISLSDLLTPLDLIMKRVRLAAEGDFVIALYNPRSKGRPHYLRQALEIILEYRNQSTPVGIVKNSGREGRAMQLTTLSQVNDETVDMMSIVLIGNSKTYVEGERMITPRGYDL